MKTNVFSDQAVGILESISDAFFALDRNWNFIYLNKRAEQLIRKKRSVVMGKSFWEIFPDTKQTIIFKEFQHAMKKKEKRSFEIMYEPYNSWFEAHVYPSEYGISVYFKNIDEQKKFDLKLRASEERYRAFITQSTEGIWRFELEKPLPITMPVKKQVAFIYKYAYLAECNDALAQMYGFKKADQIIGARLPDMMVESEKNDIYITQFVKSGYKLNQGESVEEDKDGNTRYFHNNLIGFVEDGKLVRAWGTQTDITERVLVQEERNRLFNDLLRANNLVSKSEEEFRTLANVIPQFVWTTDQNGKFTFFNQHWYDYSGLSKKKSFRNPWKSTMHKDDIENTLKLWKQSMKTGDIFQAEYRLSQEGDKNYRWFLGRALPIKDKGGNVLKWFGTSTDIDDQKRLNEQKDEFIGIASHELKTPLTSIKGYVQILEKIIHQMGNEKALLYLSKTNKYINRLNSLIADLLDVSKIQAGKLQFDICTFDINELLDDSLESIGLFMNTHKLIKKGTVHAQVTGDKHRLEQVFTNLITNAIKYSPKANKVEIEVTKNKKEVHISIRDFGIGIPQKKLEKIFERFYRVESVSKRFSGLGIGLYISNEIVSRHGGIIRATSEEEVGSIFTITLPISS